jgi:hypothetical protein
MAHTWRLRWRPAADLLSFGRSTPFVRADDEYLPGPRAGQDLPARGPISDSAAFGKFVSDQLFVEQLLQTRIEQSERRSPASASHPTPEPMLDPGLGSPPSASRAKFAVQPGRPRSVLLTTLS